MASEWAEVTLGGVADFLSGGTPAKERLEYWGGSIPWVSAKDMKSFRIGDTEDHLTDLGVDAATRVVPSGTVLLLARGMTLLHDVPICITQQPMAFNQDVKALRPKPGVRNSYLPYLLLGHKRRLLSLVDLAGHGTGRLNSDELKALDVLLPPESEQLAIAQILGALDDKIDLNRRMGETLEATARALFKSWFVNFDPVRAKSDGRDTGLPKPLADLFPETLVDSELGEVPEGWDVCGLHEIARFLNGLALQKHPPLGDETLAVIKIAQLRAGNTLGADRADVNLPADYVVKDGDILFSWSGSLEVVLWAGGEGALNQHLFKVTSGRFPKWFYYFWILEHLPEFRRIAAAKATTMGHIQRHHLAEARLTVPPSAIVEAAEPHIGPMLNSVSSLRVQSRMLGTVRDLLLPRLISGALRIPDSHRTLRTSR